MHEPPTWAVSDAELVTVTPSQGNQVTIAAKRPGMSTVTVTAGEASRVLTFEAAKPNGYRQVTISQ